MLRNQKGRSGFGRWCESCVRPEKCDALGPWQSTCTQKNCAVWSQAPGNFEYLPVEYSRWRRRPRLRRLQLLFDLGCSLTAACSAAAVLLWPTASVRLTEATRQRKAGCPDNQNLALHYCIGKFRVAIVQRWVDLVLSCEPTARTNWARTLLIIFNLPISNFRSAAARDGAPSSTAIRVRSMQHQALRPPLLACTKPRLDQVRTPPPPPLICLTLERILTAIWQICTFIAHTAVARLATRRIILAAWYARLANRAEQAVS